MTTATTRPMGRLPQELRGWLYIHQNRVFGWSEELEPCRDFEPGVIAVDLSDLTARISEGGTAQRGADTWEYYGEARPRPLTMREGKVALQ